MRSAESKVTEYLQAHWRRERETERACGGVVLYWWKVVKQLLLQQTPRILLRKLIEKEVSK